MNTDEPQMGINLRRRTTQVNVWIVLAVAVFFAVGGFLVVRMLKDPPSSTEEMKQESFLPRTGLWAKAAC